jgi:hypothetical protein
MPINETHIGRIAVMVKEAESYRDQLSKNRQRAIEYYDGKMIDTPADTGRSQVVSRDVRAVTKDVLPSIMRTILGNDQVVEYQPVGQGDEDSTEQATEYVNGIILEEAGVTNAIYDAAQDAVLLRNGILKWWWEVRTDPKVSSHSGLPDDAFAQLVSADDVEVIEHTARPEMVEGPEGPVPTTLHDVKIKRMAKSARPRVAAVPPEQFLIHPDADCLENSPIVGQVMTMRRSDLVAMGYDANAVANLPIAGDDEEEENTRRPDAPTNSKDETDPTLEEVDYYELYVRQDIDGDGIAELHRMCFGGAITASGLLADDECDEVQFCDVVAERKPHQWEGISVADDVMEIQRIKTVLLRQTLDNLYWQNNPQPIVDWGALQDPGDVLNPEFGKPIRIQSGRNVNEAIRYQPVPFVAEQSFGMLEYLDKEKQQRTGVSDASAGLPGDALQNVTAKASAMLEQAGIGQTEMIVNTIAKCLRPMFRGLLRLIIRHQDVPRTVRLRGQWVQYDPRHWNAEMDAKVNTGLGAGTRERDMMMMQYVVMLQKEILASMGADNPFVKPDNLWNALSKTVEAAGLRTPTLYFTQPDPDEVAQKMEAMRNAPDPEQMKLQAQMQLEQAKMQASQAKEQAQMQADIMVKRAEMDAQGQLEARKLEFEREKLAQERELKLIELQLKSNVETARLNAPKEAADKAKADQDGRHGEVTGALQQVMAMLQEQREASSRPKKLVRGPDGEIAGIDFGDGRMGRVVRDANGDIDTIETGA